MTLSKVKMNDLKPKLLGTFNVQEAKLICELLDQNGIQFEINKHGTGNERAGLNVPSYRGATFGFGITMDIFVDHNQSGQCEKLIMSANIFDNRNKYSS